MNFPWFPLLILLCIIVLTIVIFVINFQSQTNFKYLISICIGAILFFFLISLFIRSVETKTINISDEGEKPKYSI